MAAPNNVPPPARVEYPVGAHKRDAPTRGGAPQPDLTGSQQMILQNAISGPLPTNPNISLVQLSPNSHNSCYRNAVVGMLLNTKPFLNLLHSAAQNKVPADRSLTLLRDVAAEYWHTGRSAAQRTANLPRLMDAWFQEFGGRKILDATAGWHGINAGASSPGDPDDFATHLLNLAYFEEYPYDEAKTLVALMRTTRIQRRAYDCGCNEKLRQPFSGNSPVYWVNNVVPDRNRTPLATLLTGTMYSPVTVAPTACPTCQTLINKYHNYDKFLRLPEVFLVGMMYYTNGRWDIMSRTDCPERLDLSFLQDYPPGATQANSSTQATTNDAIYELRSVIAYSSPDGDGGHYILHTRRPDNTWTTIDDLGVRPVVEGEATLRLKARYRPRILAYVRVRNTSTDPTDTTSIATPVTLATAASSNNADHDNVVTTNNSTQVQPQQPGVPKMPATPTSQLIPNLGQPVGSSGQSSTSSLSSDQPASSQTDPFQGGPNNGALGLVSQVTAGVVQSNPGQSNAGQSNAGQSNAGQSNGGGSNGGGSGPNSPNSNQASDDGSADASTWDAATLRANLQALNVNIGNIKARDRLLQIWQNYQAASADGKLAFLLRSELLRIASAEGVTRDLSKAKVADIITAIQARRRSASASPAQTPAANVASVSTPAANDTGAQTPTANDTVIATLRAQNNQLQTDLNQSRLRNQTDQTTVNQLQNNLIRLRAQQNSDIATIRTHLTSIGQHLATIQALQATVNQQQITINQLNQAVQQGTNNVTDLNRRLAECTSARTALESNLQTQNTSITQTQGSATDDQSTAQDPVSTASAASDPTVKQNTSTTAPNVTAQQTQTQSSISTGRVIRITTVGVIDSENVDPATNDSIWVDDVKYVTYPSYRADLPATPIVWYTTAWTMPQGGSQEEDKLWTLSVWVGCKDQNGGESTIYTWDIDLGMWGKTPSPTIDVDMLSVSSGATVEHLVGKGVTVHSDAATASPPSTTAPAAVVSASAPASSTAEESRAAAVTARLAGGSRRRPRADDSHEPEDQPNAKRARVTGPDAGTGGNNKNFNPELPTTTPILAAIPQPRPSTPPGFVNPLPPQPQQQQPQFIPRNLSLPPSSFPTIVPAAQTPATYPEHPDEWTAFTNNIVNQVIDRYNTVTDIPSTQNQLVSDQPTTASGASNFYVTSAPQASANQPYYDHYRSPSADVFSSPDKGSMAWSPVMVGSDAGDGHDLDSFTLSVGSGRYVSTGVGSLDGSPNGSSHGNVSESRTLSLSAGDGSRSKTDSSDGDGGGLDRAWSANVDIS